MDTVSKTSKTVRPVSANTSELLCETVVQWKTASESEQEIQLIRDFILYVGTDSSLVALSTHFPPCVDYKSYSLPSGAPKLILSGINSRLFKKCWTAELVPCLLNERQFVSKLIHFLSCHRLLFLFQNILLVWLLAFTIFTGSDDITALSTAFQLWGHVFFRTV